MNKTLTNEQHLEQVNHQIGVLDRRFERSEFRTSQRFDVVEDRLDRHDHQFFELKGSIDDLAIMTKNQFDHVYEQFDKIHEQFKQVDKRFKQVDQRFDQVDKRFNQVNQRFDKLEDLIKKGFARTDKLENSFDKLETLVKKGFGMT